MPTETLPAHHAKGASESLLARQYLAFGLGGESFALPLEHVREIIEFDQLTSIPLMPPFLRGVLNLRGAVVPVIDLQSRFGRGETVISRRTCVVIVEVKQDESTQLLGALVDAVNEVLSADPSQVERRPAFGTGLRADFVDGILNLDHRFIVTLDIDHVLSVEEMAELMGSTAGERAFAA